MRARDGTRTRGLDLGKVALHQLSHSRMEYDQEQVMGIEPTYSAWKADILPLNYTCKRCAQNRNRTNDTGIFSPLLYRLSYLGTSSGSD